MDVSGSRRASAVLRSWTTGVAILATGVELRKVTRKAFFDIVVYDFVPNRRRDLRLYMQQISSNTGTISTITARPSARAMVR
jgi:hypothetical protein